MYAIFCWAGSPPISTWPPMLLPTRFSSFFPESVAVGVQFGVVLVTRGSAKVEVATFREDVGYSDGRHPDQVIFTSTAEQDAARRDFTINGLLMRHDSSEVLDYVHGVAD